MKECRAPGLIGGVCRKNECCFLLFHAHAECENKNIKILRKDLEKIEGCVCKDEVVNIVKERIKRLFST